jgi:hypothetical protein
MSPDSRTPESSFFTPLLPISEPESPAQPELPTPSSPVRMVAKYFADHKWIDVQKFAYDEGQDTTMKITDSTEFFKFLQVDICSLVSNPSNADCREFTKVENFLASANAMAKSIRLRCECLYTWVFLLTFSRNMQTLTSVSAFNSS